MIVLAVMSSSESDEDLNKSEYDIEDNLNVYGSPIYSPETEREADSQLALSTEQGRTQVGKV